MLSAVCVRGGLCEAGVGLRAAWVLRRPERAAWGEGRGRRRAEGPRLLRIPGVQVLTAVWWNAAQ